MRTKIINKLLITIKKNKKKNPNISYTASLFQSGVSGCKKKFLEEVKELLSSLKKNKKNIIHESADVFYHYLVLLERANVKFSEVLNELRSRSKISGIEEKLTRKKNVR